MLEHNNQVNKPKKHLLILGAGASMSLVPIRNNSNLDDMNKIIRLPSGWDLCDYISLYLNKIKSIIVVSGFVPNILKIPKDKIIKEYFNLEYDFYCSYIGNIINYIPNIEHYRKICLNNINDKSITWFNSAVQKLYADDNFMNVLEIIGSNGICYEIHLKYLYVAGYLLKKYNPLSIDYFANNLQFFASYEIEILKKSRYKNEKSFDIVTILHKYLKLIIFESLSEKQKSTINYASNHAGYNYIRHIIWNMTLEANRVDKNLDPKEYIEKNLDIITFNYDITTEYLLNYYNAIESQSFAEIKSDIQMNNNKVNIIHVYSHLYAGMNEVNKIINQSSVHEINNTFNIIDLIFTNPDKIDELLEKCDYYINWIRANHDGENLYLTNKCMDLLKNANNIYFLGFGFDKNNLKQIGFTKDNQTLNEKRYFVSRGDGKVISILENILYNKQTVSTYDGLSKYDSFIQKRNGSDNVFFYKSKIRVGGFFDEIQISTNDINTAFSGDFEI